jgi:hypothetical protein
MATPESVILEPTTASWMDFPHTASSRFTGLKKAVKTPKTAMGSADEEEDADQRRDTLKRSTRGIDSNGLETANAKSFVTTGHKTCSNTGPTNFRKM